MLQNKVIKTHNNNNNNNNTFYLHDHKKEISIVKSYLYPIVDSFINHNYNKIVKSDWLSTALISALIGQLIGQYAPSRARLNGFFFHCQQNKISNFLCFDLKNSLLYHKFC